MSAKTEELKTAQPVPMFYAQQLVGAVLLAVILYGGYYHCDSVPLPKSNEFCDKIEFSLRWCALPFAVILFFTISQVGNKRGSTPASNPLAGNEHYVQKEKNILANTLEQTTVALLVTLSLTAWLQQEEMKLVPLYIISFVVGRVLFIITYKINPMYRTSGITINFVSAFFLFNFVGYLTFSRGIIGAFSTVSDTDMSKDEL